MSWTESNVKHTSFLNRSEEEDPTEAIVQELRKLDIQDSMQQKKKSPHDFGTKREHMLDEKHRRNGPVKVPFKPFRYV